MSRASYPVQIMTRAISDYCPDFWKILEKQTEFEKKDQKVKAAAPLKLKDFGTTHSTKKFVEAMVTTMDMMSTDEFSGATKLLTLCKNLEEMGAKEELFFYRYLMFVDGKYELVREL